jgi:DNA-binding CsgD family transcriptional regulator
MVRLRMGRVAAVEADMRELIAWMGELEVPFPDARVALPWAIVPLADALVERGAAEEAQGFFAQTGLESGWPEVFGFTFLLESLGRLRLHQGRVQEAVRLLRECSRRQRAWGIRNPGFLPWRSSLALALARTNRRTEALDLCDEEVHLAREFGVPREEGMGLRALAEVTGGAEAIPLLEHAVTVLAPSPARLEHVRALTDLGIATQGREPLREALDIAARLGATAAAERAQAALIATGAKPRRRVLTGPEALTAAQLRVARLAADGRSNREIAESLFLTEKTVEGHLGQAYRKLNISSRAQLSGVLSG